MSKVVTAEQQSSQFNLWSTCQDYYELTKPKVVLLLLLTALVGMCLASDSWISWKILIAGLIGIGFLSSAAAVVNHVVDKEIDSKMARTFNRPVAKGKVSPRKALVFAGLLTVVGYVILELWVNRLTAVLTLAGLLGYAVVYTMYLKRATPQNIVIGGLAGAIPPLLGWTAVTGEIHAHALLLVLIVFIWTPPHFWALALLKTDEYKNAGIPMLPVVKGELSTKRRMLVYTIALLPVSLLLCVMYEVSLFFYIYSLLINAIYLFKTLTFYRSEISRKASMSLFSYSILYIFLMFGMLFFIV